MSTSRMAILTIAVVVLISLAAIRFYPSFQAYVATNANWNGIKDFTSRYDAKIELSLDSLPVQSPPNTLVLIPQQKLNGTDLGRVKDYVLEGNRLVLMDDSGNGNDVLAALGLNARFSSADLLDPLFSYRNPSFPKITDFSQPAKDAGVQVVILNHPTVLLNADEFSIEASSSSFSFLDLNSNGTRDGNEPAGPFAVAAEFQMGQGVVQIVSDPGLIMNALSGEEGNDRFVRYLVGIDQGAGAVVVDGVHFANAPLDAAKIRFETFQGALASPFVWLGILVLIFAAVIAFVLKREDILG
jgi:hypothetical protein